MLKWMCVFGQTPMIILPPWIHFVTDIVPSHDFHHKLSEPSCSSYSFFSNIFFGGDIVYLGHIASYLRKKKRQKKGGVFLPRHPFSQTLTLLLFLFHFFHPWPFYFGFQPFNQSATIRADRVTGNNRGGVSGGVTSEGWGVGNEGKPKQKNRHPRAVSRLVLCCSCPVRKWGYFSLLCFPLKALPFSCPALLRYPLVSYRLMRYYPKIENRGVNGR